MVKTYYNTRREVANLCGTMASELGLKRQNAAKRAGLITRYRKSAR